MEYFTHLPEFQVVICKECQYAVLPSHIDAHFTRKPQHGLEKDERRGIIDEIAKIDGLISNEETLSQCELQFPIPTSKPIIALAKPRRDGVQCIIKVNGKACGYICCSIQYMQEHSLKEHGWKSKDKGGHPKKRRNQNQEVPWRTGVHCQRFFKSGPKSGYFEVQDIEASPPSSSGISSRDNQFKAAKQELEVALRKAEEKEQRCIKEAEESKEPNPWLRRVGWAAHLAGLDRLEIRHWIEMPDDEEPNLQILCKAFDWMIQDAQYTTVQEVVGQAALFEANRKEVNNEPQKPFDSWMNIHTVQEYTRVWKQLLCYIFRAEDKELGKRPAYKLTGRQQIAIHEVQEIIQEFQEWQDDQPIDEIDDKDESDEEIKFMGRIQRKILQLCIDLLNHPLKDNEYRSAIISGLAVLGIRDDNGWLDAEDYTPKYSAVIKLARLMVVQMGYEQRQDAIKQLEERGLSADGASEQATSYFYFIRRLTHQFMTMVHDGKDPTPMQWIFKSRSYGFKVRYTTTAEGCIQWIRDDVLYQQLRFGMSQVQSMVHGLVEEARKELFSKLMMVDVDGQKPAIDWESLVDNPAESRVGWSFLDDERTKFAVDGQWWLYERMIKEQKLREQFMDERPTSKPKKDVAEAYQRHIDRFRELLLILMHLCSGQPGRAPEILGIRWKNTEQGGVRNIFIEDGLVAVVTGYHKGYRSSNDIKIIHRYLPREIGELLVYYLWLVLPFHEKLQFQAQGKRCSSPFLWGDSKKVDQRQWTGPKRGWRDRLGGGRSRRSQSPESQSSRSQSPESHSQESQSLESHSQSPESHSQESQSPEQHRQEWTSERLRKIIQKASIRWMGVKLNISAWRQIAIAISRRYCRENPFQNDDPSQEGGIDEDGIDDDPWDLQTGHGTHIAGMIYARELMEGNNMVIGRREKFRLVSQEWHRFWQFESAGANTNAGQKRKHQDDDMQHAQMARWKRLRTVDIHDKLKQMLGDKAEFRGLQKPALEAIMSGKSPILVVMGTGAGKSLLFQLPARSQKSGTTVVIVPLKSLERSLYQRCQEASISCIRWDPQNRGQMAQIVLVQPEAAVGKTFAQYLNKLQGLGQLDRVVIDECHTVLDSKPDFRPEMRKAGAVMLDRGVQMVYLTATLSPADEAEFLDIMKVEIPDDCKFRGCTSRPNIAYSVVEYSSAIEQTDAVCHLMAKVLEQYPAPAKVIVYSSNIETIKELGSALNCHTYYAEVGSAKEKDQIQQQWESGNGRVVVASNAFGLGIDQPDVRVVIHVGPIHRMRDYGQESGRGGRDGQRSEAIILVEAGRQEALQAQFRRQSIRRGVIRPMNKAQMEREKVDRFISGAKCRRIHLDQEMDGRIDRVGCEDGEEKCDVCQKDDQAMADAEALQQAFAEQEQDQMLDSAIDMPSSSIGIQASSSQSTSSSIQANAKTPSNISIQDNDETSQSPTNSISFNPGFTAADQDEFQVQQANRWQQRQRMQAQNQQEGHEIWELEQQLEEWKGRCPLCFINGDDSQHSIDNCVQSESHNIRKRWKEMKILMKDRQWFAAYSCCFNCHVPQCICQKWVQKKEQGRWERSNINCQFDDIIMPVVVTAMLEGKDWMISIIQNMAEENGLGFDDKEQFYRWYGQKVDWGGIEATRLVQMFYKLAKGMEIER